MLKPKLSRIHRLASQSSRWSILGLTLVLSSAAAQPSARAAEPVSADRLYSLVLDSISCDGGSDMRAQLAQELKKSSVKLSDARRDSISAVNRWCRLQLRKNSTSRELESCRNQYQSDLNKYLAKAIVPNAYPNESARFTWRRSVAPVCNLTKSERKTIADLGASAPAATTAASDKSAKTASRSDGSAERKPAANPADAPADNNPAPAADTTTTAAAATTTATPAPLPATNPKKTGGSPARTSRTRTTQAKTTPASGSENVTPDDIAASSDTETEAGDNLFTKSMRTAGHGLRHVLPDFLIPSGDKGSSCPHSKDFADMLANHSLHPDSHTLDDAAHTPLENQSCTSSNTGFNQNILDAIFDVHSDLKRLQTANPGSSLAKSAGGGYGYHGNAGTNLGYMIGKENGASAAPGKVSFCSAAYVEVFMKTINNIAGGKIFDTMTEKQRRNFKPLGDNHGVYGILNGDEGAWDLAKYAPRGYPIVQQIGGYQDQGALKKACAGDMMAWDRKSNHHGHAAYFLGNVDGKAYFWSSNQSTRGYGVTCEKESDMLPKIVRLTHPENLAALPEYNGQTHLAGTPRPDIVALLQQNSTPAPVRTDNLAQLTTTPPDPTAGASRAD